MEKKRVTLTHVANAANVSPMTVSLALKDSKRISGATSYRVKGVAQKLGYIPSISARSLRNSKTHMICCLLPYKDTNFFGLIFDGIQEYLDSYDYHAMMSITRDAVNKVEKLLDYCMGAFDGIILDPVADVKANEHFIERLKNANHPFVITGPFYDCGIDCVCNDEVGAVYEAINWLIKHGHKKIAWISGRMYQVDYLRLKGYKKAIVDSGIEPNEKYIQIAPEYWGEDAGYLGSMSLLRNTKDITAIFVDSDESAKGVYRALAEYGVKIPDDISIIGYGNSANQKDFAHGLSSVEQHPLQIGKEAAKLLLSRIQGDMSDFPKEVLIKTSFIKRDSCIQI